MERLSILINQKAEEEIWKGIKASRNTNPLTHLFFADDLILFGQDNIGTCNTMIDVLNEFCCMSGQTISLAKSKLFVSPNVPRNKARRLSAASGISLTNDLGKYLGIPLLHKRVSKDHFNHILEKIQKRLSCWKSNTLMLAGRATLIQSSASPIPSYTMQTMKFPASVCDKIDRLHRNFLWGDMPNKKRIHLVNWNQVCKGKDNAGLGIKKARDQNLALLSKLGWSLSNNEGHLWVDIMNDKYLRTHSLSSWPKERPASFTWRSILSTSGVLRAGTKWVIGDGKKVDIWLDWWCGTTPLALLYPGDHTNSNFTVSTLIVNGKWHLDSIAHIVDCNILQMIQNTPLPLVTQASDHPSWKGSPNGNFSVSAAYKMINGQDSDKNGWKWFWKLKIPEKLKTFIWTIFHNKLPTNLLRAQRGMSSLDSCPRCNAGPEDINHLFRTCLKAVDTWRATACGQSMRGNLNVPLMDWFGQNLRKTKLIGVSYKIPWNILFISTIWQIWKDRNRKSFDNLDSNAIFSSKVSYDYAVEIVEAFKSPLMTDQQRSRLTKWVPPIAGNIKLNVDGCWYNAERNAGIGGIFRDCNGTWTLGFYGKMIAESSTEAEIWSIYRGLTIILEKGLANVDIESDSLVAVNIINAGTPGNHPQSTIINDAKMLLQQTESKLTHIYRDANQCADHLARMGAEQNDNLIVIDQAPISIREFLIRDCLNLRQILD
ncbi:hypothetical protein RHGRI_030220 [Rhododendron griersonianum]|uniref:Uncharacterized protein n=1 Tax=Rhododendron griersonianum TaxID=479676 RepID=A0AAV6IM97_9ERIC|nr:hypothetical protein RHGRI_030220 [Rhododendron griersonianum]